jgi:hypothetical protein
MKEFRILKKVVPERLEHELGDMSSKSPQETLEHLEKELYNHSSFIFYRGSFHMRNNLSRIDIPVANMELDKKFNGRITPIRENSLIERLNPLITRTKREVWDHLNTEGLVEGTFEDLVRENFRIRKEVGGFSGPVVPRTVVEKGNLFGQIAYVHVDGKVRHWEYYL